MVPISTGNNNKGNNRSNDNIDNIDDDDDDNIASKTYSVSTSISKTHDASQPSYPSTATEPETATSGHASLPVHTSSATAIAVTTTTTTTTTTTAANTAIDTDDTTNSNTANTTTTAATTTPDMTPSPRSCYKCGDNSTNQACTRRTNDNKGGCHGKEMYCVTDVYENGLLREVYKRYGIGVAFEKEF